MLKSLYITFFWNISSVPGTLVSTSVSVRFLAMDEAVLRSTGEGLETGSGRKNTSLDSSLATLHQAENKGTVLHFSGEGLETESGRKNTSLDSSLATLHQAENKVSCDGSVGYRYCTALLCRGAGDREREEEHQPGLQPCHPSPG